MAGEYQILDESVRRHPAEDMIESIRKRYPAEAEIDAVHSRKMRRRNGPGYEGVQLQRLIDGIKAMVEANVGHEVAIENGRWLSGGASKLQVVFDLRWRGSGGGGERLDRMVLRMEPAASVTESSRYREFEILQAVQGIIPVPAPHWVDGEGHFLPYPALIYGFASGVAKPSLDSGKVSGLGQNFGPELRAKLAPEFVGLLGRLHGIDVTGLKGLAHFERPQAGSNASVIRQVHTIRRIWEEDRIEEEPALEIIYRWLIANAPPLDHVSIVHGDYRSGNFLFDEETGKITAWLDWEGATLGDRHQDLTYAALEPFSHYADDGRTLLASGLLPVRDLHAAYEAASGFAVDPARLLYYEIYNRYLIAMLALAASARASRIRGTHQDVLVNFVAGGLGYSALGGLLDFFRGVTR